MKLQELNVLLEAEVDTVGIRLLEISEGLLRRAAKRGVERADKLQSFLSGSEAAPHVNPVVLNYRAQAARFTNRADKKMGYPFKDLSDAEVKRTNPRLYEHLRLGRRARTLANQVMNKGGDTEARAARWQDALSAHKWKGGIKAAVGVMALAGAGKLHGMYKAAVAAKAARAQTAAKVRTAVKAAGVVGAGVLGARLLRRRKKER